MSQASNAEFHTYVGFCITAWAKVDEQLFEICADVLATKRELAAVVYYRIPTLGARLGLAQELVPQVLPQRVRKNGGHDHPDLATWKSLAGDVEDLLADRTRIAHHPVDIRFKELSVTKISPSFALYVSAGERLRGRHEHLKPLTADHLSEHCMVVQQRARVLRKFRQSTLRAHLK